MSVFFVAVAQYLRGKSSVERQSPCLKTASPQGTLKWAADAFRLNVTNWVAYNSKNGAGNE